VYIRPPTRRPGASLASRAQRQDEVDRSRRRGDRVDGTQSTAAARDGVRDVHGSRLNFR
jgi:hypothetical protein